jgi:hypothetical protein
MNAAAMVAAQIQCHGCKKKFTFSGYSQHVSKTRRADCRAVHARESSLFETTAASQPLVDSGLPPDATRSPADPHNISVPSQLWTDGALLFDLLMTGTANLGSCFRL